MGQPDLRRLRRGGGGRGRRAIGLGEDDEGDSPLEGDDPDARLDRRHAHLPARATSGRVVVAVVDEGADLQRHRIAGTEKPVAHVGRVRAGFHEDALLQAHVAPGVGPDRRGAVEPEALEVSMARRGDRPVRPAVRPERPRLAAALEALLELGHEHGPSERWLEGGDEEPVVASGERSRHRPGRESADPVGDEPLPRLTDGERPRDLATPVEAHGSTSSRA